LLPSAHLLIPQTCARCHSTIYDQYKESVHGQALTDFQNPDVPTCIDCHGVHNIQNPTTTTFRNTSTEICAKCHTDPARMSKYNISTRVLDTYVSDFHGTTVTLFQKESPGQVTNKPVCFDCHGIHNIARPDDPQKGLKIKQNLLVTCQKCHPDASTNFPDAWLSHYVPSPEKNPLVYYVNLFYRFFIPTVVGGMVVFVASDFGRRVFNRYKGAAKHERH
jgi:predicted CXXCH cytochrome family protein